MRVPLNFIPLPIYQPKTSCISFAIEFEVIRSCIATRKRNEKEKALIGLGLSKRLRSRAILYWSPAVWGNARKAASLICATLYNEMGAPQRKLVGHNDIASFDVACHIRDMFQRGMDVPAAAIMGPQLVRIGLPNQIAFIEVSPTLTHQSRCGGSRDRVVLKKVDTADEIYHILCTMDLGTLDRRVGAVGETECHTSIDVTEEAYKFARAVADRVTCAKKSEAEISSHDRAAARRAISQIVAFDVESALRRYADLGDLLLSLGEVDNAHRRDLREASLREADLREADLERADLREADLTGADLREADLERADLREANLREADLERADLRVADLRVADLMGADLTGADLTGANLIRADLTVADLTGANLTRANLTGANLTGANLTGANLWGANLRALTLMQAVLTGADLTVADLTGANLTGTNLTGANLTGANLTGANLWGTDLRGATGASLTDANLTENRAWVATGKAA